MKGAFLARTPTSQLTTGGRSSATLPFMRWQEALETFRNTLTSRRTIQAYDRAVTEAMQAMGVELVIDLAPPILAEYRAGLVARLDADREDRPSPSTVSLKLSALRPFLHFCRVTGLTTLSKDVITFVLKSPKAEVQKP